MTKEETINELKKQQNNGDIEVAHVKADQAICGFLISLGYQEVVDEWDKIDKWYA